jgi:uncharacterized protein
MTAVVSLGLLIATFVALTPRRWAWGLALWTVATILLAWFSQRWPVIEYRHMSYRLNDDGIEIRSGVFWRSVVNVPRSRVQHTDVAQGPLERSYELGRLVIHTAGTEHSRVELPGLEYYTAMRIRDWLLPRESGDAL